MQFLTEGNALIARTGGETLKIEGWGKDSLRVRAVMYDGWTGNDWALTETPEQTRCEIRIGTENSPIHTHVQAVNLVAELVAHGHLLAVPLVRVPTHETHELSNLLLNRHA